MRVTLTAEEQRAFFLLMGINGTGVDLCDEESLKKAFRRKAKKSHPDQAVNMGKDPRLMKLRFQELNDAFNILMERVHKEQTPYTARSADPVSPASKKTTAKKSGPKKTAAKKSPRTASKGSPRKRSSPKKNAAESTVHSRSTTNASITGRYTRQSSPGRKKTAKTASTASTARKKGEEIFFTGKTPGRNLRFAEYLYYSGSISWTELVQALVWQYRNRPKLGELATESGLLDFADVLDIIRAKNANELFGEAAVRLGYLSSSKLDDLVREQKKLGCPIGHYFTSENLMTSDTLHRKLSENRRHNILFTDEQSDS